MGRVTAEWQNTTILGLFGDKVSVARRRYLEFVKKGRVADIMGMAPEAVWVSGKQPKIVQARSLLCYWATGELGVSQAWLSRKLGISQAAVSLSVSRGRRIALENHYEIGNL